MGYIGGITHLLTIDPNFQRDIQVYIIHHLWNDLKMMVFFSSTTVFFVSFNGGHHIANSGNSRV